MSVHRASTTTTIQDVAHLAGVSIKTVSLVLNESPDVAARTRDAVSKVMKEIDYRPNANARALAGGRSYLLGMMLDDAESNYVIDIESGALERCRADGFHLALEFISSQHPNLVDRTRKFITTSRLRGLILTPPLSDHAPLLSALTEWNIRYVRVAPGTPAMAAVVGIDDRRAAYDITRHLVDLGHGRIAFIKGKPSHISAAARFDGFCQALRDAKLPLITSLIAQGDFSWGSGMQTAEEILRVRPAPTAIFACNDEMAAGTLAACSKFRLDVPRDVSIAGFDDALISRIVWPPLTTCQQPLKEMGYVAVDMLLNWRRALPPSRKLNYQILLRGSTVAPAKDKHFQKKRQSNDR